MFGSVSCLFIHLTKANPGPSRVPLTPPTQNPSPVSSPPRRGLHERL